jgi:hypothetical protein
MWHTWLACIAAFPPEGAPPPTGETGTGDTGDTGDTGEPTPIDPLAELSDEFDDPSTLADWQEVWQVEGWDTSQLEVLDLGQLEPGALTMIPRTTAWYDDWRGPLLFKEVTGDVVVTTEVVVTNRAGTGIPQSKHSIAGLMLRRHRDEEPYPYQVDQEDWVMLALGRPELEIWALEAKSTLDGLPTIELEDFQDEGVLRLARVGDVMLSLYKPPGGEWAVMDQRSVRPDLPETLQVGLITATDSETAVQSLAADHNHGDDLGGTPDLHARFEYAHFATPVLPQELQGLDLSDETQVSDAEILSFLGND